MGPTRHIVAGFRRSWIGPLDFEVITGLRVAPVDNITFVQDLEKILGRQAATKDVDAPPTTAASR